jgi:hypothetical protein
MKLKTVEELIDYLQQYSGDTKVRVCRKNQMKLEAIAVSPVYIKKLNMILFEISNRNESIEHVE